MCFKNVKMKQNLYWMLFLEKWITIHSMNKKRKEEHTHTHTHKHTHTWGLLASLTFSSRAAGCLHCWGFTFFCIDFFVILVSETYSISESDPSVLLFPPLGLSESSKDKRDSCFKSLPEGLILWVFVFSLNNKEHAFNFW